MPTKIIITSGEVAYRVQKDNFRCIQALINGQLGLEDFKPFLVFARCMHPVAELRHSARPTRISLRPPHVRPPARPPERTPNDAVVPLLAQTTLVPPVPLIIIQIVLLRLRDQNLRLTRQTRHVRDAQFRRRNAITISTCASAHKAFSRARMHGLEADVAFLPLGVVRCGFTDFPQKSRPRDQ